MTDGDGGDEPIRLFGDPRAHFVERGPERRVTEESVDPPLRLPPRTLDASPPGSFVRLGRGDVVATALTALGIVSFVCTLVVGSLILYNAKSVGAFSNPWDSTRVAIGLAVYAVGTVLSAVLIGISRVIEYLVADLRFRSAHPEPPVAKPAADRVKRA